MRPLLRMRPLLAPLGGVLMVLGAGLWAASPVRPYLLLAGVILLALALVWCLVNFQRADAAAAGSPWLVAASPQVLLLAAALLHVAAGALPPTGGKGIDWPALFAGGWAVLATLGAVLLVPVELALWTPAPPAIQAQRVRRAAEAGTTLGLLLVLVATLVFLFDRLGWQWDLSYFRTTQPGSATLEVVEGLTEPVDVALFFADGDAVGRRVLGYARALAARAGASAMLNVQAYDADLEPARADEFKARGNGRVVLRRGAVLRTLAIGTDLREARGTLRKLDGEFLKELLHVARQQQVVYLTVGHGERNEQQDEGVDKEQGTQRFAELLRAANFEVRPLGYTEGLGTNIPDDAALVGSVGPQTPFRPAEVEALRRYLQRGGRVLLFLEPRRQGRQSGPVLPLLKEWGLSYDETVLANAQFYARRTFTPQDQTLLVTNRYMNHVLVRELRANAAQNPLVLFGAGTLVREKPVQGIAIADLFFGMPGSWGDRNGNFKQDAGLEPASQPLLGAVVTGLAAPDAAASAPKAKSPAGTPAPDPRSPSAADKAPPRNPGTAIVFADADLASDLLMRSRANNSLLLSAVTWLAGEEQPLSAPASEEDVQLLHAKRRELAWFYLPVFVVPLLVLGIGAVLAVRRGRRQEEERP